MAARIGGEAAEEEEEDWGVERWRAWAGRRRRRRRMGHGAAEAPVVLCSLGGGAGRGKRPVRGMRACAAVGYFFRTGGLDQVANCVACCVKYRRITDRQIL